MTFVRIRTITPSAEVARADFHRVSAQTTAGAWCRSVGNDQLTLSSFRFRIKANHPATQKVPPPPSPHETRSSRILGHSRLPD